MESAVVHYAAKTSASAMFVDLAVVQDPTLLFQRVLNGGFGKVYQRATTPLEPLEFCVCEGASRRGFCLVTFEMKVDCGHALSEGFCEFGMSCCFRYHVNFKKCLEVPFHNYGDIGHAACFVFARVFACIAFKGFDLLLSECGR